MSENQVLSFLYLYNNFEQTPFTSFSIAGFEQVNVSWSACKT